MTTKFKLMIAAAGLLTAFAFGRWSAPEYKKTETDQTQNKEVEKHKTTTIVEKERPDGTKEKKTVVEEDSEKRSEKSSKQIEEIVGSSSRVTVSALAGIALGSLDGVHYGASVSKPILGPIALGAFYLTPGIVGASIGLTF
jgi:hypothetical protein